VTSSASMSSASSSATPVLRVSVPITPSSAGAGAGSTAAGARASTTIRTSPPGTVPAAVPVAILSTRQSLTLNPPSIRPARKPFSVSPPLPAAVPPAVVSSPPSETMLSLPPASAARSGRAATPPQSQPT
jgi:hypothetical protein